MSELDRSSKARADAWLSVSEGKSDNADEVGIIYTDHESKTRLGAEPDSKKHS